MLCRKSVLADRFHVPDKGATHTLRLRPSGPAVIRHIKLSTSGQTALFVYVDPSVRNYVAVTHLSPCASPASPSLIMPCVGGDWACAAVGWRVTPAPGAAELGDGFVLWAPEVDVCMLHVYWLVVMCTHVGCWGSPVCVYSISDHYCTLRRWLCIVMRRCPSGCIQLCVSSACATYNAFHY